MTFAQFSRQAGLSRGDICREILASHRESIKAKKEATAVKNLELIFDATLALANQKGFQAMTVRDLSRATGLSMGALYDYFTSKEELLEMVLSTGRRVVMRLLEKGLQEAEGPVEQLRSAIRTHLFLSEAMQPFFFFAYMEARHLGEEQKERAKQSELATERLLAEIIQRGVKAGLMATADHQMAAALIKAMLQDWYLKRWKYAKRRLSVDRYAGFVEQAALALCLAPGLPSPCGETSKS
ncbi:MAG: TetR/AcrR family transcriptional regulator [Desulfarculus sp.]|nr:TetR/AcrR family transcriptional regulator [Desulfarculus sp.]